MAEQGSEIHRRAIKLTTFAPPEGLELMKDLLDQYETVTHISDSQLRFLIGVTEFYRARTDTKMTIAAERLAVIAVLTLPITSLSSVMGMNVIVNNSTRWIPLIILLLIMLAISLILLRWARNKAGVIIRAAQPVVGRVVRPTSQRGVGSVLGRAAGQANDTTVSARPCVIYSSSYPTAVQRSNSA
jgi:CorA-like Mg2+ transporter protein